MDLAAIRVQELKGILGRAETVGLEVGMVAVGFHHSLGLHKVDAAAVVEIGLLGIVVVAVVGNWRRTAGNSEAVKKVAVVEQDSMRAVPVAAGPVGNAVSAAGFRVPLVGSGRSFAAVEASGPILAVVSRVNLIIG